MVCVHKREKEKNNLAIKHQKNNPININPAKGEKTHIQRGERTQQNLKHSMTLEIKPRQKCNINRSVRCQYVQIYSVLSSKGLLLIKLNLVYGH